MKSLKKFAFFAAFTTIFLHIANKVIFFLALVKELLPTKEGSFYDWKFGKVFYTKEGDGSPLLLIHDLQAESSGYEWSRVKNQLAKDHTVYTLDLPGCGRSEKPRFTYTSFLYVQLLEGFLKDVVKESVSIAACGASASFVLHFAAQNTSVEKLILINPSSFEELSVFPTVKTKIYNKLITLPVFGTCIYNYNVSLDKLREKFCQEYFHNDQECAPEYVNAYYESAHLHGSASRYLFASIAAGFTNMPVVHVLGRLSLPVEIISGKEKSGAAAAMKEYGKMLPNARLETIDHAKQLPQLERPEQTLALMRDFLAE